MPVIGWEVGNANDPNDRVGESTAKDVLRELCRLYPGYSWIVQLKGGLLMIRNYTLDWRGRYCMVRKLSDVQHDHGRLIREVRLMAGEFLERANMRRQGFEPGTDKSTQLDGAHATGSKRWTPEPNHGITSPVIVVEE